MKALNDFVIIKVNEEDHDQTTKSGIIVKHSNDKKAFYGVFGEVVSVGPNVKDDGFKKGDKVIINKYDDVPLIVDNVKYSAVKAELIIAKV